MRFLASDLLQPCGMPRLVALSLIWQPLLLCIPPSRPPVPLRVLYSEILILPSIRSTKMKVADQKSASPKKSFQLCLHPARNSKAEYAIQPAPLACDRSRLGEMPVSLSGYSRASRISV